MVKDRRYKALLENQVTYINDRKKLLNKVRVLSGHSIEKGHLPPKSEKKDAVTIYLLEVKCREYIEKVIENDIEAINLAKDDIDLII